MQLSPDCTGLHIFPYGMSKDNFLRDTTFLHLLNSYTFSLYYVYIDISH